MHHCVPDDAPEVEDATCDVHGYGTNCTSTSGGGGPVHFKPVSTLYEGSCTDATEHDGETMCPVCCRPHSDESEYVAGDCSWATIVEVCLHSGAMSAGYCCHDAAASDRPGGVEFACESVIAEVSCSAWGSSNFGGTHAVNTASVNEGSDAMPSCDRVVMVSEAPAYVRAALRGDVKPSGEENHSSTVSDGDHVPVEVAFPDIDPSGIASYDKQALLL